MSLTPRTPRGGVVFLLASALAGCGDQSPADRVRASGQVEATEVQVAAPVAGRIFELHAEEGARVEAGVVMARLDTADAELALQRARADRALADAQLRLLRAGSRPEEIRQAEAQAATARAEAAAADADLAAAEADLARFEQLLASNSGSRKQRDDAAARRNVARERAQAARDRIQAAAENVARLRSGARPEEIAAAQARVAAADAQIATSEKALADATVTAPLAGVITAKLVDRGELVAARTPLAVITDLDHAWASVYVDEPVVPRLRLGQPATLFTDAGGPGIPGKVSYISPVAEFTPRNVQTAEDRSRLVYRIKISVDNTAGTLKSGMPVEADIPLASE
jgi:HlyD family secretion protein